MALIDRPGCALLTLPYGTGVSKDPHSSIMQRAGSDAILLQGTGGKEPPPNANPLAFVHLDRLRSSRPFPAALRTAVAGTHGHPLAHDWPVSRRAHSRRCWSAQPAECLLHRSGGRRSLEEQRLRPHMEPGV